MGHGTGLRVWVGLVRGTVVLVGQEGDGGHAWLHQLRMWWPIAISPSTCSTSVPTSPTPTVCSWSNAATGLDSTL